MTSLGPDSIPGILHEGDKSEIDTDSEYLIFKSLAELYPAAIEYNNAEGTFLEIDRSESISCGIIPPFSSNSKRLQRKIELVRGVGPHIALLCRQRGTRTIGQLIMNRPHFASAARLVKTALDSGNYFQLRDLKSLRDIDFIHCFHLEDLLFLDVETLGLRDQPIFLIGVGHFAPTSQVQFEIRQWFARDIGEEIAILRQFMEYIKHFKCLVSFNGKTFDLNVLQARSIYYFNENFFSIPVLHPESGKFSGFHHIDLFHEARNVLKSQGFGNFRFSTIESHLLGFSREETRDIPSREVPRVYQKFLRDPTDTTNIFRVIEHNYFDVLSLARLLGKILHILMKRSQGTGS